MSVPKRKSLPNYPRPKTYADCLPGGMNEQRPCPYAACKHHLAVALRTYSDGTHVIDEVAPGWDLGEPLAELDRSAPTCTLDEATSMHGRPEVARLSGIRSPQLVRYVEMRALESLPRAVHDFVLRRGNFSAA